MNNQLDALKAFTTVVADTGSFNSIRDLKPTDATTNPSLILKAVQHPDYLPLLDEILEQSGDVPASEIADELLISFGKRILDIIPGRVSTEVDARLSFDARKTADKALDLVRRYESAGIDRSRVLIKIACTWEGVQAAAFLEKQNVHCNMTLLFSLAQAIACANAGVTLISPFVGRIYDWHKKAAGASWVEADHAGVNDPGVKSVSQIFHYYKRHGIPTEIMGASFRNKNQILALAGCDLLTISPELLQELASSTEPVEPQLKRGSAQDFSDQARDVQVLSEAEFRFHLNQDAMATEKLAEGIRNFVSDAQKLESLIRERQQALRTPGR